MKRNIRKEVSAAHDMGRYEAMLSVVGSLTKKECIRYLEACQEAGLDPDRSTINWIAESGYLAESKHLTKLYKQLTK